MNAIHRCLAVVAALAIVVARPAAAASPNPILMPDKLIVLSTTDVMGKTAPCGCHVPKGGLSRRATFVDSLRTIYGQVLLVDNGGFVPMEPERIEAAGFLMDAMKALGTEAVNIGERDVKYGRAFLVQRLTQSGLTPVSANLLDKATGKPLFAPYLIKKVGTVNVGLFGLFTDKAVDMGPSKDSLQVANPQETAKRVIAEMRGKGAQVIVLLSQLGSIDTEDLATAVPGIDVAIMGGRNVSPLERGRKIGNTIGCYGGAEGHYVCMTEVDLDAKKKMADSESHAIMLGPEVADKPAIAMSVKAFEDALAQKGGSPANTTNAAETGKETPQK